MEPILTIAIPTYNHHNLLRKQLISLIPQITSNINLYIIDNCSSPSVRSFLEKEGMDITSITIIENEVNIGGDANILKCFSIAQTKWVWVLSDNDIVNSNAIKIIIDSLDENVFFINFGYAKNKIVSNYLEFCKYISYVNSFAISNCIYNKTKLKSYEINYQEAIDTHQGQLIFILNYFENNIESKSKLCKERLFDSLLTPQWPKLLFILDAMNMYKYLDPQKINIIRHSNLGHQIISMHIILLSIARSYENITSGKTIKTLFLLLKSCSIRQILTIKAVKALFYFILSLFSPSLYRKLTPYLFSHEFNLSIESKTIWK